MLVTLVSSFSTKPTVLSPTMSQMAPPPSSPLSTFLSSHVVLCVVVCINNSLFRVFYVFSVATSLVFFPDFLIPVFLLVFSLSPSRWASSVWRVIPCGHFSRLRLPTARCSCGEQLTRQTGQRLRQILRYSVVVIVAAAAYFRVLLLLLLVEYLARRGGRLIIEFRHLPFIDLVLLISVHKCSLKLAA